MWNRADMGDTRDFYGPVRTWETFLSACQPELHGIRRALRKHKSLFVPQGKMKLKALTLSPAEADL